MEYRPDDFFMDGQVAKNTILLLQRLPVETINEMIKNGHLVFFKKEMYILSYRVLRISGLSAYAKACGVTARSFLFGSEEPVVPTFTPYDGELIQYLNVFSDNELRDLIPAISAIFPVVYPPITTPSAWVIYWRQGVLEAKISLSAPKHDPFECKVYSTDICAELMRLRRAHYGTEFRFATDSWIDVATFFGVSLHHIWQMEVPLYCNTQNGDLLFDLYTLLPSQQKLSFVRFMERLAAKKGGVADGTE